MDGNGRGEIQDGRIAISTVQVAKVLKQTVKRNIERFPNGFRFELSKEECLRSQIVTSNGRGGNRYSTYAFTEQGVAILSSVLRSKIAVETFRLSHDRFLCIDDDVYHIGASIKDLPGAAYFLFCANPQHFHLNIWRLRGKVVTLPPTNKDKA